MQKSLPAHNAVQSQPDNRQIKDVSSDITHTSSKLEDSTSKEGNSESNTSANTPPESPVRAQHEEPRNESVLSDTVCLHKSVD